MGVIENVVDKMSGIPKMANEIIASDLLDACKLSAALLTDATLEASSPELRQFFQKSLNRALDAHGRLSKTAEEKGWYHAHLPPVEEVRKDLEMTRNLAK